MNIWQMEKLIPYMMKSPAQPGSGIKHKTHTNFTIANSEKLQQPDFSSSIKSRNWRLLMASPTPTPDMLWIIKYPIFVLISRMEVEVAFNDNGLTTAWIWRGESVWQNN